MALGPKTVGGNDYEPWLCGRVGETRGEHREEDACCTGTDCWWEELGCKGVLEAGAAT